MDFSASVLLPETSKGRKPWSKIVVPLVVLIVVISSLGAYEYTIAGSLQSRNSSLISESAVLASSLSSQANAYTNLESSYLEESNVSVVIQAFESHLSPVSERNATGVAAGYASNATMKWVGNTQGLGGIYNSSSSIEFAWETFLSVQNVTYSINSVNATRLLNATVIVQAELSFQGYGKTIGYYNVTTSGTYTYMYQTGQWLISREVTLFKQFNTEYPANEGF